MINSHLLDPPATSQYPSYSFHIRRFFQRVFFSKILINTCLVTFVRLSVWQFIYVSAISTGNRAGNQNRTGILSLEDWRTNRCAIPAKFSVFITVKPNCKNFFHLRWSNEFDLIFSSILNQGLLTLRWASNLFWCRTSGTQTHTYISTTDPKSVLSISSSIVLYHFILNTYKNFQELPQDHNF